MSFHKWVEIWIPESSKDAKDGTTFHLLACWHSHTRRNIQINSHLRLTRGNPEESTYTPKRRCFFYPWVHMIVLKWQLVNNALHKSGSGVVTRGLTRPRHQEAYKSSMYIKFTYVEWISPRATGGGKLITFLREFPPARWSSHVHPWDPSFHTSDNATIFIQLIISAVNWITAIAKFHMWRRRIQEAKSFATTILSNSLHWNPTFRDQ